MGVFEMVTAIVVIGCVTGMINNYLKTRQTAGAMASDEMDEAFDRIDNLEERIRVLEKVVTDDRFELKQQLERLEKE